MGVELRKIERVGGLLREEIMGEHAVVEGLDQLVIIKATATKKPSHKAGLSNVAPSTGLEPVTYGLTVRRSTD